MASTYEKIATTTASGVTSITLSSIPATYTDLILIAAGGNSAQTDFKVRFNGDTATNYSNTGMYSDGSSASGVFRETDVSHVSLQFATNGNNILNINNYSNTTTFKTILSRSNVNPYIMAFASLYRSTSAINSVTCFVTSGSYSAGTTFTLYGIKAE